TGDCSSSSTAIPAHCAPCPGKTNTVRPTGTDTDPDTTPAAGSPPASADRPALWSPTTTARCSNRARDDTSDQPTATGSAPPANANTAAACPRTAAALRPDTTHGTTPGATAEAPASRGASSAGASSRITWTFVPLMPKADTPAR